MSIRTVMQKAGIGLFFLLSFVATSFLIANGTESFFNINVPYVHALDPVSLGRFSHLIDNSHADNPDGFGALGAPVNVKIPTLSARLEAVPAVHTDDPDLWLARASKTHVLNLSESRNSQFGLVLFYTRSGFRTIENPHTLSIGDNVFIDTDQDWRYVLRITEVTTILDDDSPYVPSDSGENSHAILVFESSNSTTIVEASTLSVQGLLQ